MVRKARSNRWVRGALAGALVSACVVPVLALTTPAEAATCGAKVTYGSWSTDNKIPHYRPWTWTYHNCSRETEHERVDVAYAPDSKCFSIGGGGTATYKHNELDTPHTDYYRGTKDC